MFTKISELKIIEIEISIQHIIYAIVHGQLNHSNNSKIESITYGNKSRKKKNIVETWTFEKSEEENYDVFIPTFETSLSALAKNLRSTLAIEHGISIV